MSESSQAQVANVVTEKHKANVPLFLKHCDRKSSYCPRSPWGKFALEANNFKKAETTNVRNTTLSREKKKKHTKNQPPNIYWWQKLLFTVKSAIWNLNWTSNSVLVTLLWLITTKSPLFYNHLKRASSFPRGNLFSIIEYLWKKKEYLWICSVLGYPVSTSALVEVQAGLGIRKLSVWS